MTKEELKWATILALTAPPKPRATALPPNKLVRQNGIYADVGAVPTSRTVNGKALSADISLTASDVGAATTADSPAALTRRLKACSKALTAPRR